MIYEPYSGSATVGSTEYSLTNNSTSIAEQTTGGEYSAAIDLSALQSGDQYVIRAREKARASDTQRVVFAQVVNGAQDAPLFITAQLSLINGWDFTLQKTGGTDRSIQWSIRDSSSPSVGEIADAVWDEILTGATHNIATSAGRRLRQLSDVIVHEGTAQGPGTGPNQIQLDVGASSSNGAYDPSALAIISGTGAGQCRMVFQYDGATRTATVDRDWRVLPDATSVFQITSNPGREQVNEGLAQAGTSNTITLNVNASPTDGAYVGQIAFIRSGTGADQAGLVTAYNGTTKVATINHDWPVPPDTTSAYAMLPAGPVMLAGIVHTGATIPTVTTVSGSVGSVAADGITSSSLAGTAITEIQSGLATAAAVADIDADVVAVKAKTDSLNFSGNNVLSDIRAVRGDAIVENGSASTNWGKAP